MNCSTWQKFQGVWLGSVIANIRQKEKEQKYSEDWLLRRKTIAIQELKATRLDNKSLAKLEQFLSITHQYNTEPDLEAPRFKPTNSLDQKQLAKYEDLLQCLLPLIIFRENNQELLKKSLDYFVLKSLITLEEQEDILIWSYILYSFFNSKFTSPEAIISQIISQVLNDVGVNNSALPSKLEIVVRAWEKGLSLYQLTEELNEVGNPGQIAIALAVYCFAATPRHFGLAIQRAENVSLSMSWLVIALTATLSGAYNGIARIPWSWRARAYKHQIYQLESQLVSQLFASWLGIYSSTGSPSGYSQELNAVAQAHTIQTRKALKIISQNDT